MKKAFSLVTVILFPVMLMSQNQQAIFKDQDTVVVFPSDKESTYYLDIQTNLTPEELHSITLKHANYNFGFRDNEDLRLTMSSYMEDGKVVASWKLTDNEQRLLKKYKKMAFNDWKQSNKSSSPTSKNNVTAGEHLQRAGRYKNASIAILIGSTATATALISADPSNSSTATIIGAVGALASLGLNIAGNMELIAAGKAIDNKP